MFRLLLALVMAVAESRAAVKTARTGAAGTLSVAQTLVAGETGTLVYLQAYVTTSGGHTISSIAGGGTWTSLDSYSFVDGLNTFKVEWWGTSPGSATAASSVVLTFTGTSPSVEGATVFALSGAGGYGNVGHNNLTAPAPTIAVTMQEDGNLLLGLLWDNDSTNVITVTTGTSDAIMNTAASLDYYANACHNSRSGAGSVSVTGSCTGSPHWGAVGLEVRGPLNVTFYLNNPIQGGSNAGFLDTTAPTASTSTTGWTVGTIVPNQYSRQTYNTEVPTTGFTGTAQPSGSPVNLGEDCFRSAATSGTFSAGTWYSSVSCIAVSSGGIQQGRARFRLWRSTNADGTSATEITQGTMIGSQVTELNTSQAQTSSASTQVGSLVLSNEYIFTQIAWETL